jgi:hypothetical protein
MIGLNCLQPFAWTYPFANGGNDATVMPDARLTTIKTTGFDFVRMAVDNSALLGADSASNVTTTVLDTMIAEIITGIQRRTALGLKVILDFHFKGDISNYVAGYGFADVFDGGTKAARMSFVAARLGAALHTNINNGCGRANVCYEFFNEPPSPATVSTASYIVQLEAWWTAIRAAMPLHTIVVAGNNLNAYDGTPAGQASGLTSLTASHFDVNTGFAYHDYENGPFTMQGAGTYGPYSYGNGIRYPASLNSSESAVSSAFTTAAGSDTNAINMVVTQTTWASSIHQYFVTYGSKSLRAARLKVATDWSDAAGISRKRIFNTEGGVAFNASDDASDADAAQWIQDAKDNATAAGISCMTVHEMQGSTFGIQNTTTPWAFNASIQAALFP